MLTKLLIASAASLNPTTLYLKAVRSLPSWASIKFKSFTISLISVLIILLISTARI
jgi:hypothetical protein